jgi:LysM repeat protein
VQTFKTALVVVALLAALFVAWQVLNKQPIDLPFDLSATGLAPDPAFDAAAELSVEAPAVDAGASQQPWPNAAISQSGSPNSSAADISPPSFAVSPPSSEAAVLSPATDAVPGYARQASQITPAGPEPPASGLSSGPLSGPLRSGQGTQAITESSSTSSVIGAPNVSSGTAESISPSSAAPRGATAAVTRYSFEQAWQKAELQIADGQLARALLTLSAFYHSPDLDEATQSRLNERLDQLAGTVIYSKRHLLEGAYKANRNDTLHDLAARYSVSAKLLQNINGIQDPTLILPGTDLKMVRGPFRAEIDLSRGEATMFLGGLYAGRFAIRAGRDPAPKPGEYKVLAVETGRTYYLPSGQSIPAGAAANPYGQWWIDLGSEQSIHGSPEAGAEPNSGCLSLAPRDAADVAAILSVGSKVVIR